MPPAKENVEAAKQLFLDIACQFGARKTCPNKDFIVKLLRQAESSLQELKQSESLITAIKPLIVSFLNHGLLRHKDKDVRLLVASCFCEIIRLLAVATELDFSDVVLKDIFELFLGMFAELADTKSPYFARRIKLLEIIAEVEFYVVMLDRISSDLVLKMFNTFFGVVREYHPEIVFSAMSSIMSLFFTERVSQTLLEVILQNLLKEVKGVGPASYRLAVSVIRSCSEELEPIICRFLTYCILNRDGVDSELREFYHEIILEILKCAPQMLAAVIPNLSQELLTDQIDVRIKAIKFVRRLFAVSGCSIVLDCDRLFIEFLNRFSDKSAEVRLGAVSCAKTFYLANSSGDKSVAVLTALEGRLLDFDDKVRAHTVEVVCDLAKSMVKPGLSELISQAAKRLRDKKVSVRKKALQQLLEVYRCYCIRCAEGIMELNADFEQIPCGMLLLSYDKEFGPQNMEHVVADDMFPSSLSVKERTRHWIFIFSLFKSTQKDLFSSAHEKALNVVLSQKRRFQIEMQRYLVLRTKQKDISGDTEKRIKISFTNLSKSFPDTVKAEDCFHNLHLAKDPDLFDELMKMLMEVKFNSAQTIKDTFLGKIGDKHQNIEFLRLLASKCSFNIFSCDHIHHILDDLSGDKFEDQELKNSSLRFLMVILGAFPLLLRGLEEQFCSLLSQEKVPFTDEVIQILVKAGPQIAINHSEIYPLLERVCLEGTRTQSKHAISAVAALCCTSGEHCFEEMCKALLDALESGKNLPTVLQSLGCMAQHSVSAFETRAEEITRYIIENIFLVHEVGISDDLLLSRDTSTCSASCKLKVFGLKALVKSFLPHQHAPVCRQIDKLLEIILCMLQEGEVSYGTISCETDKEYIRLAAAKSVLRLSQRWDFHISPELFRLTVLMAKAPSASIRRSLVVKTYNLMKKHSLPIRYACSFAFAASDSLGDSQKDDVGRKQALKYMPEFVKQYSTEVLARKTSSVEGQVPEDPMFILMFLVHVLAHDADFPSQDSEGEGGHSLFCSPLAYTIQVLINHNLVDGNVDRANHAASYIRSIFNAISRAEDAVNSQMTTNLHIIAKFGISKLNELETVGNAVSHTRNQVWLPSCLYRKSLARVKEISLSCSHEITPPKVCSFRSQPVNARGMHGQDGGEEASASDVCNHGELNMVAVEGYASLNMFNKNPYSNNQGRGTNFMSSEEQDSTSCPPGSARFCNKFPVVNGEDDWHASENSVLLAGSGQLQSSSNSVDKMPSAAPLKNDMVTKINNVTELSKFRRKSFHSTKEASGVYLQTCKCGQHLTGSCPSEVIGSVSDASSQPMKNEENMNVLANKLPLPGAVKERKGHKVSPDRSVSEVIQTEEQDCIARRTRQRKC